MLKCGIDVGFGKKVNLTQFFRNSLCGMNVGFVYVIETMLRDLRFSLGCCWSRRIDMFFLASNRWICVYVSVSVTLCIQFKDQVFSDWIGRLVKYT